MGDRAAGHGAGRDRRRDRQAAGASDDHHHRRHDHHDQGDHHHQAGATADGRPDHRRRRRSPGSQSTAQKLASDLFDRLNAERRARGLAALDWDGDLARVAGDWSAEMASSGNFRHRDLGAAGGLPGMAKFSALGENIAWVEGYPSMGNQLHVGWMRSEGHRANMLQRGFDSVGIGVVCSGGRAWATQNFGRLDNSSAPSMGSSTPAEEPIVATRSDGVRC